MKLLSPSSRRGEDMGLFSRKCAWCGARLPNPSHVERMGKRFYSEDHAQQYLDHERARTPSGGSDGCC